MIGLLVATMTEPSEAQIEAGNYKKEHRSIQGLDITIENEKGSTRSGTSREGKEWSIELKHDYGYIKSTQGADKDHIDVFIGPWPDCEFVLIINQVHQKSGRFDEHKVMLGFQNTDKAKEAYLSNYESGWKVGSVQALTMEQFKLWLEKGDTEKRVEEPKVTFKSVDDKETFEVVKW